MSIRTAIASLITALILAGCSGYEPIPAKAPLLLHLAPVVNESAAPQIIAPLSRNLREHLLHDRNWTLVSADSADVVLHIRVTERQRTPVARDPADTGRPLSFRESLLLEVEWDSSLPAPWGSSSTTVLELESLIYSQPGLIQSESTAYGEMAERAAREILSRLNRSFHNIPQ